MHTSQATEIPYQPAMNIPRKVLIYCRISAASQLEGHGLRSQEYRCRHYAKSQHWDIAKVFEDDFSGGGDFMRRPGIVALLKYLDQHPQDNYIVLFDDLKRFARDREFHFKLRAELAERRATPECLNFSFDDTPEGEFMETIFAAQGQLEHLQNRRQVVQKMKARIEQGYAVFSAPVGLTYKSVKGQGKMLFRDEPVAGIVQEALEGYASGRFQSQAEIKRFLESQPDFPKSKAGYVTVENVHRMLNRPVYAGYVEAKTWGVTLRQGRHDGLISFETYCKIQERLKNKSKVPCRKDISEDFPLRNFVLCGDCEKPLTANWATSKSGKKHPYYSCYNRKCTSFRKSIRRDVIEGACEDALDSISPSEKGLKLMLAMFKDAWEQRSAQAASVAKTFQHQLRDIEKQTDQFLERIMQAHNNAVVQAYEKKIADLETEKLLITEKLQNHARPKRSFDELFEHSVQFLQNPRKLWDSPRIEDKKTVLKLAFGAPLIYHRNEGVRTPIFSSVFGGLGVPNKANSEMADKEGLCLNSIFAEMETFETILRYTEYDLSQGKEGGSDDE